MQILEAAERNYVRERLGELPRAVRLTLFTRDGCEACQASEQLARELTEVVPGLSLQLVGEEDRELVQRYGIDKWPALAVEPAEAAGPANGIRFYGFPGGYEFDSLLEAVRRVSRGEPGLGSDLVQYLAGRVEPLRLQVFVTQTCPWCPRMVQLAHRMALASPRVRAEMIDAAEFPRLAALYGVQGVPLTVIDGRVRVVGAVPEGRLLAELLRADRRGG
jgi:glutaredoxin-like protein